ncbi:hypothetical protein EDF67_112125 [Sphingobacterium sp. JUb78]|nr:hypothetical protein EDF67_112125 [Sphingobacterium sp. JUb78]
MSIYKKFYKWTFHNIINLPSAVKTGKSRSQLTFRQIAGIRESAFSISQLFTIADGEEIIRQGFARWPDVIVGELKLLKKRMVDLMCSDWIFISILNVFISCNILSLFVFIL